MNTLSIHALHASLRKKVLFGALFLSVFIFCVFLLHATTVTDKPPIDQERLEQLVPATGLYTPGVPSRLIVPSIGVDAAIESLGLVAPEGALAVPKNFVDVGWYKDGPRPGTAGSAVIDGHFNGKHVPEAVFFKLGTLSVGDSVFVVDKNNHRFEFLVTKVRTFNYLDSTEEVFDGSTEPRLNLITCAGDWLPSEHLYDKRTVVFTKLVSSAS